MAQGRHQYVAQQSFDFELSNDIFLAFFKKVEQLHL